MTQVYSQDLQNIDYFLYQEQLKKGKTTKSWDGYMISPYGSYGSLNLFINIIYDQTPNYDPYPNPNGMWNPSTIEGINTNLPTYLLGFMDIGLSPSVNGTFTRKYYESSFGQLIVSGDFIVINIKQSRITPNNPGATFNYTALIQAAINMINTNGGLNTVYGNNSKSYYDRNNDGKFDLFQVIIRNNNIVSNTVYFGGPYYNWASNTNYSINFQGGGTLNTNNTTATRSFDDQIATNANQLIIHEFAHHLLGSNEFHTSGGHSYGGVAGQTFFGLQGGYGLMGGGGSGMTSCNGYERWRLHWKDNIFNSTNSYIAASNVNSDIQKSDGNKTFILRDFVTTGDAIRIKLPYKDAGALNQYIWLENHEIGLNNKIDYLTYSISSSCRPIGTPGIYSYIQVGKDILESPNYSDVYPQGQADNLKMLSAEGNYNLEKLANEFITCVMWGNSTVGRYINQNSLTGNNDITTQFKNQTGNQIDLNNAWGLNNKYFADGTKSDKLPSLMDIYDAFSGTGNLSLSTNPTPSNILTYYNWIFR